MEIIDEVQAFLKAKDSSYREFLNQVRQACESVKGELGGAIVRNVYGRDDKQATGIFKTAEKIAKALTEERLKRPASSPASVQDIIGLTIVVHYPDEIRSVVESLKRTLPQTRIVKDTSVIRNGYYAYHVVFQSRRTRTIGLHCEVQVKTMLHDAWAAKTHDLNYKPRGQMDDRLSRMMQVFGDALQSIEMQSEMLRDMIYERWNTDLAPRRAVRERLFEYVPNWRKRKQFGSQAEEIVEELTNNRDKIVAAAPEEGWLSELVGRINDHGDVSLREATWLAIQLAMIRESEEFISFANGKATDLVLKSAQLLVDGVVDPEEVATLPLAVAAYGDSPKAIELSRYLARDTSGLKGIQKEIVAFNLANLLVEDTIDRSLRFADRDALKEEVMALISACTALRLNDQSAFVDLERLSMAAFSDDPAEIRKGIDLLQQGRDNCHPEDKAYAEACYELNARKAWRRLLELEGRAGRPLSHT